MPEQQDLRAVEEAAQSKAALYRLGANLIKYRVPVTAISVFFTAIMAYYASGIHMSTSFSDLLPYRHPFKCKYIPNLRPSSVAPITSTSC